MRLDAEQEDLLVALVEAERRIPHGHRDKFLVDHTDGPPGVDILHPGWPSSQRVFLGNLELLAQANLINMGHDGRSEDFYVTPAGFAYYADLKSQHGEPLRRIEKNQLEFISGDWFRTHYPKAHEKWHQAESLLWEEDSRRNASIVGHLVREAMQEFADSLVTTLSVPGVTHEKSHTVARIRAAIEFSSESLGSTVKPFLDALLTYWGTLNDLVQRQEHAAQREAEDLLFPDARRIVFHSAAVMFELHNTLVG